MRRRECGGGGHPETLPVVGGFVNGKVVSRRSAEDALLLPEKGETEKKIPPAWLPLAAVRQIWIPSPEPYQSDGLIELSHVGFARKGKAGRAPWGKRNTTRKSLTEAPIIRHYP